MNRGVAGMFAATILIIDLYYVKKSCPHRPSFKTAKMTLEKNRMKKERSQCLIIGFRGLNNLLLVQETVTTDEEYEVVPFLESRNMHKRQSSIYKGKVLDQPRKGREVGVVKLYLLIAFHLKNMQKSNVSEKGRGKKRKKKKESSVEPLYRVLKLQDTHPF